jgi:tryptophan synthase alpha chain
MSAIDELFHKLRAAGQKALMPFITAGDPDLDFTAAVIRELAQRGAHLCEVGIPYSDPIADGPVIQASYTRALEKRVKLTDIMQMLSRLTDLSMPRVTMVSYAIVYRHGPEKYLTEAKAAGISGAIIPDLLVEEAHELSQLCRKHDFSLIQLVTPTTPRERALRIAQSSTGFLYYVSVTGITGERQALPPSLVDNVGWLREQTDLPICIGFGISSPDHILRLSSVADGFIVGSAFVRRIASAADRPREEVLEDDGRFATELLAVM